MIQFTQGSKAMDIRPIVTDDDYEAALAEIKRLWSAEADSLKFRMDQQGLTRKDGFHYGPVSGESSLPRT
jgi:hypothetical protein